MTRLAVALAVLAAILAAVLYLRFGGVTHARIVSAIDARAEEIKGHADVRFSALDRKLDRIEAKLDRLLEIAARPLPDGMQPSRE